jgi:hypothetical protein
MLPSEMCINSLRVFGFAEYLERVRVQKISVPAVSSEFSTNPVLSLIFGPKIFCTHEIKNSIAVEKIILQISI